MTISNTILEKSAFPKIANWVLGLTVGLGLTFLAQLMLPTVINDAALSQSEKTAWYLTRASGIVGYLLLTLSTIWGLLLSTRILKSVVPAPLALAMHNLLAWSTIGLTVFHAGILLFDNYYTYTIANLFVPFTGPYEPGWVGAGIISFYLMLLTAASFNFRKQIGQKNWRRLHYLTFLAYILVTLHAIVAGTDTARMMMLYAGSGFTVFFLTIYRILTAKKK